MPCSSHAVFMISASWPLICKKNQVIRLDRLWLMIYCCIFTGKMGKKIKKGVTYHYTIFEFTNKCKFQVLVNAGVDRRPKPTAEGRIFYSYGYGGRRFRAIASAECTLEISMSDESTIEGRCLPQANFCFFSRFLFMSSHRYAKM